MTLLLRFAGRARLKFLGIGLVFLGAAGCRAKEEISRTTEPHVEQGKKEVAKGEKIPTKILGAISTPNEEGSWFFKIMGPAEAVAAQEKAFDTFLASVELSDKKDKPVTWTLPPGWSDGPQKGRYATILTSGDKDAVEVSIMSARGSLLDNVNRWRGQVGLEPIKNEELGKECPEVTTKQGKKLTRVDLSGTAGKGPPMAPFMMGK